jgi:hypothetical protein
MKTLIVSFAIWIFIVPAAVAVFLISTTVAVSTADLYFTVTALALALSILAIVSGPSWFKPFFTASVRLFPKSQQHTNSIKEIKYEKSLEGRIRS